MLVQLYLSFYLISKISVKCSICGIWLASTKTHKEKCIVFLYPKGSVNYDLVSDKLLELARICLLICQQYKHFNSSVQTSYDSQVLFFSDFDIFASPQFTYVHNIIRPYFCLPKMDFLRARIHRRKSNFHVSWMIIMLMCKAEMWINFCGGF